MTPYKTRRKRLMDARPDGMILVRGAGPGGTVSPNFFYLTGLREPSAALLMARDGIRIGFGRKYPGPDYQRGRNVREIVFLPAVDPLLARWGEGAGTTADAVSAESLEVDMVFPSGDLEEVLASELTETQVLYVVRAVPPTLTGPPDGDAEFVANVRRRYFGLTIGDLTPRVEEMRRHKDDEEIAGIRRAVGVTHEALQQVWSTVRAGMRENEVEAEITRHYRRQGGTHAFDPIVAAGPRACVLHYCDNDREIEAGQLLLIDTGVSLDGYGSDITRTFPVDGKFTERQREIYEAVLGSLEAAVEEVRPGVTLGEIHARAYDVIERAGFGEAFIHGTSHHLGIETHDVGDRFAPLAPGAVFTVEPGVYLPDEGIGVRIEDDVVVTDDGHEILSAAIPRTVREIEAALRKGR